MPGEKTTAIESIAIESGLTEQVRTAYEDALDDVHTRFVLNLPPEEMATSDRIFFQLEQAYWFYDDFHCDNCALALPRFKGLKPFALKMFQMSPLLAIKKFDKMWEEFTIYRRQISTYGTILLNPTLTKMILCQAWKSNAWTFPAGKVNQNENGTDAAARETYEETGFDPNCILGETKKMLQETPDDLLWKPLQEDGDTLCYLDSGKRRTMYVCANVPEDFNFMPVARKEVSAVEWHGIDDIPKKSFAVLPFMKQLRRWIKKNGKSQKKKANSSTPARKRPNSTKKSRSQNSSRTRVAQNDPLTETGLASPGEVNGWTEDDMFKANENLLLHKGDRYDGNPHVFAERGFAGKDPHAFHVVGGTFMNSDGAVLHPRTPSSEKLQPLTRDVSIPKVLQPFFSDGPPTLVVSPASQRETEASVTPSLHSVNNSVLQNAGKKLLNSLQSHDTYPESKVDSLVLMTDAQVTARSQITKQKKTSLDLDTRLAVLADRRDLVKSKYAENQAYVAEWFGSRVDKGNAAGVTFRFDTDSILAAMSNAAL